MDMQLEYLWEQVNATKGWKVKHHHTDLLKDLHSVLTPMTNDVSQLQEELAL